MLALRCRPVCQVVFFRAHFSPALCFAHFTPTMQRKRKSSAVDPEPSSPRAAPLSQEQLDMIARNKEAALNKLSPPGFAGSWQKALAVEFGKPYFRQVTGPRLNNLSWMSLHKTSPFYWIF